MKKTIAMLLAGGVGSRLNILARLRAKPAVPFGGVYRIIDFTVSNVMHSGLNYVAVLTQYRPFSLMRHIGNGAPWGLVGRSRGIKILPPSTGKKNSDWYRGTADAITQNLDYIERHNPERVLILSGDHIYRMDYRALIDFHKSRNADITIATMDVAWENTKHFGIACVDSNGRIIEWEEKPRNARNNLASMGIYVFNANFLYDILKNSNMVDFGKEIIPNIVSRVKVYAYYFHDYWADVGTLRAYWEANMDILRQNSGLDLKNWNIRTNTEEEEMPGDRPPTYIGTDAIIENSVISPGCNIEGEVYNSVLSPGVTVEKGARVRGCVIMHDAVIGSDSMITESITDKSVRIGKNCNIGIGRGKKPNREFPTHVNTGLTIIGKWAEIPNNTLIGRNTIVQSGAKRSDYVGKEIPEGEYVKTTQGWYVNI